MSDDIRTSCRSFYQVLSDYLDGELTEEDMAHVREHIVLCPPCGVYLESFKDTIRLGKEVCCPEEQQRMPENLVKAILAARDAAKKEDGE